MLIAGVCPVVSRPAVPLGNACVNVYPELASYGEPSGIAVYPSHLSFASGRRGKLMAARVVQEPTELA